KIEEKFSLNPENFPRIRLNFWLGYFVVSLNSSRECHRNETHHLGEWVGCVEERNAPFRGVGNDQYCEFQNWRLSKEVVSK
ncbi:MAG: hypothetical protein D6728_03395, partial [Cyanobacteria bacterium J055]